jgi:hypothetical protein
MNGRIYEGLSARLARREPRDLYHTALQVHVPEGRFLVETMWPSPDADTASRGMMAEGPVFGRCMGRVRLFRYEMRLWRDSELPDADQAVGGPRWLSTDPAQGRRLLDQVSAVPRLTWGRDQLGVGDMWNSNSVISWLLTRSGLPIDAIRPPAGGRAPGWRAGIAAAERGEPES